jgi:hypothetical protein
MRWNLLRGAQVIVKVYNQEGAASQQKRCAELAYMRVTAQ